MYITPASIEYRIGARVDTICVIREFAIRDIDTAIIKVDPGTVVPVLKGHVVEGYAVAMIQIEDIVVPVAVDDDLAFPFTLEFKVVLAIKEYIIDIEPELGDRLAARVRCRCRDVDDSVVQGRVRGSGYHRTRPGRVEVGGYLGPRVEVFDEPAGGTYLVWKFCVPDEITIDIHSSIVAVVVVVPFADVGLVHRVQPPAHYGVIIDHALRARLKGYPHVVHVYCVVDDERIGIGYIDTITIGFLTYYRIVCDHCVIGGHDLKIDDRPVGCVTDAVVRDGWLIAVYYQYPDVIIMVNGVVAY